MVKSKGLQSNPAILLLWPLFVFGLVACGLEPAEDRRIHDASIGIAETQRYRFASADGLLHVQEAGNSSIVVRAGAAEFSLTFERTDPSLSEIELRIWNVPESLQIDAGSGALAGAPDPALDKGKTWTLPFTSDTMEVRTATSPAQPFTFLAFGDIQGAADRFGDMVDAMNEETDAEFVLVLGDMAQTSTPEEFDRIERHFTGIRSPLYATPGNHDIFRERIYQDRFGRANYSMTYRGVRFTSVDSASAYLDPVAFEWFERWLQAGRKTPHVIFSHIPPIEYLGIRAGQWNSRREARAFIAQAVQNGVDLMLFGHVHTFNAYALGGIPTYISGGAGAIPQRHDGIDRHYLRIRMNPENESPIESVTAVEID